METEYPRLLVSTVGAWKQQGGSNTMTSLVENYPKDSLASLYIRADLADTPICDRYFHIYEGRVLSSIFGRRVATGEEYSLSKLPNQNNDLDAEQKRYSKYSKKRSWFYVFLREFAWLLGHWKSKELDAFLDDYKPEVLFFPIESYIHFNRINEYILKKCRPKKVVGYMWDDNFTYKQEKGSFGFILHRCWLRYGVKRLVKQCDTVFAICPKMKRELDAEYGIDSVLLTKPIYQFNEIKQYHPHTPIKILYTGKLLYGRDETIAQIVDAIKEINKDSQKLLLQIYTDTELSEPLKERIIVSGCCELKGFVPQSEALRLQSEADVLLFVESLFDNHLTARLSFSTKITDYLAAGACIWAVGDADLAPIEYLREEDSALVSTSIEEIHIRLREIVKDPKLIHTYALKAQRCGKTNHNQNIIHDRFISSVIGSDIL